LENSEFEKSKAFNFSDIIEYTSGSVVSKTIIKKTTGGIIVVAFDTGEALTGKFSPYDTFIHVVDGKAKVIIDDKSNLLETGESIIIPAHSHHTIKAKARFKMLSIIIKSGYEEVI
jgi:quercetin dioxygenase-like cupin family protein